MPHCGIQSMLSTNWNPAFASSQVRSTPREMTKVASETARPNTLTAPVAARGKKASTIAPAIGNQRKVLSNGIKVPRYSHNESDEHHHADEEHQRVVADVAGLEEAHDLAEAADDVAEHGREAVDDGVDALPEESRECGQRTDDRRGV